MTANLADLLDTFSVISRRPIEFLSVQEELAEQIKDFLKEIYDYTKHHEDCKDKNTLPRLIIKYFDEEQIWQQLELQNSCSTDDAIQTVSQLVVKKQQLKFPIELKCNGIRKEDEKKVSEDFVENEEDNDLELDDYALELDGDSLELDEDGLELDEDELEDEEMPEDEIVHEKKKLKPSVVDDKFFKLSELELFLQSEEKKEEKPDKEGDSFDLFDGHDEQEAADYKYRDFFAKPNDDADANDESDNSEVDEEGIDLITNEETTVVEHKERKRKYSDGNDQEENAQVNNNVEDNNKKRVRFTLLDSDDEEKSEDDHQSNNILVSSKKVGKNDNQLKSSFEERQERLGRVIEKLEEDALSEKPWQLKGEATASSRPRNSLLEEVVDFDLSVRPAPVISEEVTLRLEDVIIQRIKDKAWDDVERKVKPVDAPSEFKKKLALDQEKSKLSLAEVYEQEFIKQREAATADDTEKQEEEPALHVETKSMLHTLFNKLDALSNYHFTPRPVAPELKVVTNVPALVMEEVAPVTVADSTLLAPQEIRGKKRIGELMSKEERTETDKKRARRLKKTRQRQRQREKMKGEKVISKLNPGLGNKYSKLKVEKDLFKSSNISKMEESKEKVTKSSTAFFNKLQDEIKSQIKIKSTQFTKKKDKKNITAKKLKL